MLQDKCNQTCLWTGKPYDGLLLQDCPLEVSLLPKLCGHHQSHLETRSDQRVLAKQTLKHKRTTGEERARTLLWTSHGLVMADRSHAVIIIALQRQRHRRA